MQHPHPTPAQHAERRTTSDRRTHDRAQPQGTADRRIRAERRFFQVLELEFDEHILLA